MKYFLVPESDIEAIETERKNIHEMNERLELNNQWPMLSLTSSMYRLTHRRYRRFPWFWRKR